MGRYHSGKSHRDKRKLANRGLNTLLSNVIGMERRVRVYLQRFTDTKYKKDVSSEVLKTYFEEIVEACVSLEEKVINSIEDWTDILPDAEIKSVVDLIRDLKEKYSNSISELKKVNDALQETRVKSAKSDAEIDKLIDEKKKITEELKRIDREVQDKTRQVGIPGISGSLITGSTGLPDYMTHYGSQLSALYTADEYINNLLSSSPVVAASYLAAQTATDAGNVPAKDVTKKKIQKQKKDSD